MLKSGEVVNDVLVGQESWLFLWHGGQRQFDYLMGEAPSVTSVKTFTDNLRARQQICEAKNIPFRHVVFPSKPIIEKDHLPEAVASKVQSLFNRHYRHPITESGLDDICSYPEDALISARSSHQVYRRTDTHMTSIGDAIVAREILTSLGYAHDPLDHMYSIDLRRKGDLAKMLKSSDTDIENILIPNGNVLQEWDNRAALPSNTGNVVISFNPSSVSAKRLLILGDSFFRSCLWPLSTFFREILYVRSAYFQPELLHLFSPDVVLSGNAERYLSRVSADADAHSVVMAGYARSDYNPDPSFSAALRAQLGRTTYPKKYQSWRKEAELLSFYGLGIGKTNGELISNDQLGNWMQSLGNDPTIVFDDVVMHEGVDYLLCVSLESDTQGNAQAFIGQMGRSYPFTEQASVRRFISKGRNFLKFAIPATNRINKIRFDPLDCPGRFRIVKMELLVA